LPTILMFSESVEKCYSDMCLLCFFKH